MSCYNSISWCGDYPEPCKNQSKEIFKTKCVNGQFHSSSVCGTAPIGKSVCDGELYDLTNNSYSATAKMYVCENQNDLDSLNCVKNGHEWDYDINKGGYYCNDGSCDTTMNCISYPMSRCIDVPASSQITCYNGQCSGLPYSMWWSEYVKECQNECGTVQRHVTTGDTAVTFGYSCSDGEEECFNKVYCTEIDGNYILYKKCLVGREVVGNVDTRQQMPVIEYTASGTCLENGYQSEKYEHSNGGVNSGNGGPIESQSDDCLVYGVGCSDNYKDTINYNEQNNKNPTNNCYCKPFDSMNSISQIVCPDGSVSIVYMSCNEWENMFRSSSSSGGGGVSSSTPAPPSTSASQPNTSDSFGTYPSYPPDQPTTNKNVQGVLAGVSEILINVKNTLLSIKDYLTLDNQSFTLDSIPNYSHGEYFTDSSSFAFDTLLKVLDTNRVIIDTSTKVSSGTCPVLTGNFSQACKKFVPFLNKNDLNLRIDLNNISGFSLCSIFKSIVIGFASVVSFFIGFSIFGKTQL